MRNRGSALAEDVDARFAERLRIVRQARRLTLDQVADMVGLANNTVQQCEVGAKRSNGTRQPPRAVSIGEAIALCRALGVGLGVMCDAGELDVTRLPEWRKP